MPSKHCWLVNLACLLIKAVQWAKFIHLQNEEQLHASPCLVSLLMSLAFSPKAVVVRLLNFSTFNCCHCYRTHLLSISREYNMKMIWLKNRKESFVHDEIVTTSTAQIVPNSLCNRFFSYHESKDLQRRQMELKFNFLFGQKCWHSNCHASPISTSGRASSDERFTFIYCNSSQKRFQARRNV